MIKSREQAGGSERGEADGRAGASCSVGGSMLTGGFRSERMSWVEGAKEIGRNRSRMEQDRLKRRGEPDWKR